MLLLIPLLPLVGFLINAALGRRLPKAVSGALACLVMIASFGVSVAATLTLLHSSTGDVRQQVFEWLPSGDLQIPFALRVDPLGALMILIVTGIGALIHIYSTAYMHDETAPEYARYFSYLNLFAAFMLVLVLGSSFPVMFIGWEGVGLCSYLLIGFWFRKRSAADAGKKAFVVNRIGDFGFLLGMLLIFKTFGSLDFQDVAWRASQAPEQMTATITLATLLLFVGATGKSAQIPLYVWLPDAMEGPTPVSALIHAATMVTAGVYMIGRNAVLFSHAPMTLGIVAATGTATALMAGTIGLVQHDIKRVLAYSTVSQLGYMFLGMGVGAYAAGIFHLYTHAFFKALLFLGSGAVIHALAGEQDLRNMGGLKRALPMTYWTFLIGAIAIAGVPPLAGFFSKDEILFRTFSSGRLLLWTIGIITSLLTATYMFRLVFLAFHGERPSTSSGRPEHVEGRRHEAPPQHPEEEEPAAHHVSGHAAPVATPSHSASRTPDPGHQHAPHLHDAPPAMALVLIVLAVGSVVAGFIGVPHALGGSNRIEAFLEPSFHARRTVSGEFGAPESRAPEAASVVPAGPEHATDEAESGTGTELKLMALSTGVALGGIGIASYFFLRSRAASDALARRMRGVYTLLLNKYYVDELYDAVFVQPIEHMSIALWRGFDAAVIDGTVNGVGAVVSVASGMLRRLQTGSIRAYAASLFLGVVVILGWYLSR